MPDGWANIMLEAKFIKSEEGVLFLPRSWWQCNVRTRSRRRGFQRWLMRSGYALAIAGECDPFPVG